MSRILVIDDDVELGELLVDFLTPEGFCVELVHESETGLEKAVSGDHAMVVLDVMLPDQSGFDVLRRIRAVSSVPVIMLTARGDEVDRIVGLEMGADDYLAKPFNPRELVARLRAISRRVGNSYPGVEEGSDEGVLSVGDLILEPRTRQLRKNGETVTVTSAEFSLLHELLDHAGRVVSRKELTEKVLGRKMTLFDRSVDVHVASLRKKLGHRINGHERIATVRGVGYMYAKIRPVD